MNSIIPAFRHLWQDLSSGGKLIFTATIISIAVLVGLMVSEAISDSINRAYYRQKIIDNAAALQIICANAPPLCKESEK